MKKTETVPTETATENVAHKNAITVAKTIEEILGKDFFTIEQMRKKMIITTNNNQGKRLSWNEARGYIAAIIPFGLIETLPAVKDCYKVRLDEVFQINYLANQIKIREKEILEFHHLVLAISKNIELPAATKEEAKKTKTQKTPKKTAKIIQLKK